MDGAQSLNGKVDILAFVQDSATISNGELTGIHKLGYRIYEGDYPDPDAPNKQPVIDKWLLDYSTFDMSERAGGEDVTPKSIDYLPAHYDRYSGSYAPGKVDADVIYSISDSYRAYKSLSLYGPDIFSYIVTNNTNPTPTNGNPRYLNKEGAWDTAETESNCPRLNCKYTVVIQAEDYKGNSINELSGSSWRKQVYVNNTAAKGTRANGTIINVNDDNTSGPWDGSFDNPFVRIEQALAVASSGDYIHVAPGVYDSETFPLEMVSGVTLHGDSPYCTFIRMSGASGSSLISCVGVNDETVIEGFQLIGGFECILVDDGASPVIQNNIIRDSNAVTEVGGGITVRDSSNPVIFNNLIIDNKIYGILCSTTSAVIMNNTIVGHTYEYSFPTEYPHLNGKGIYLHNDVPDNPPLIIRNNVITDNYYGVMKAAQENSFEDGSYNNVSENIAGNYWEIWPLAPPYVRNFSYSPLPGTGELHVDPQYAVGPYPTPAIDPSAVNAFYLSQPSQSLCVDAGDDSALPNCSLSVRTTSVDGYLDEDQVDMGFHYEFYPTPLPTNTPTPVGTWYTATPIPTYTPQPAAGDAHFDAENYYTINDTSYVFVFDWDRNTNPGTAETVDVNVTSDTDPTGITMTLTESDVNTGKFSSMATGYNLDFSTTGSDDINEIIWVSDGDNVTLAYTDTQPPLTINDYAVWGINPEQPTATPSPVEGSISFDTTYYFTDSDEAILTVIDPDLNLDCYTVETVDVDVTSNTDPTGISVTLYEQGSCSSEFATWPLYTNLTFSTTGSDDLNEVIHVTDGDIITATYAEANPSGDRVATAIWIFASPTPTSTPTPTVTPTATSTPPPIPTQSTTGLVVLLAIMGLLLMVAAVNVRAKQEH